MNVNGWDTCIDTKRENVNGKDILLVRVHERNICGWDIGREEVTSLVSRNLEL